MVAALAGAAAGMLAGDAVAAAFMFTEVSAITIGAASFAASVVANGVVRSVLSPSQNAPQSSQQTASVAQGALLNSSGTIDPINVVYGSRRIGGTICYMHTEGSSNQNLHLVLALCEGEVSAINTVYLNGTASDDPKFGSNVTIEKFTGTDTQTVCVTLSAACPGWTSTHTLSGVAYLYVKLTYDQTSLNSMPTITADVDGRKVFDPRSSTTVFSNNPALCVRDYLTNTRYGRGIPSSAMDDSSFIAAANACDVAISSPPSQVTVSSVCNATATITVTSATGLVNGYFYTDLATGTKYTITGISGTTVTLDTAMTITGNYRLTFVPPAGAANITQATYTCDGLVNTDQVPITNLSDMLTSCRGFLVFSGGKYKLKLDQAGTAGFDFTEDNILGQWSIKLPEKRVMANRVSTTFFDPSNNWQPNIDTQESTTYRTQDNGVLLEYAYTLPYTSNLYRVQQIGQQLLKQSRKQTICQFTATIAGLRCEVGDLVTITHSTPGWASKVFRVMGMKLLSSDEVEVTALEYDANVYNLDPLVLVSASPGTNLPDPSKVAAPGTPSITESLYDTTGSAGVKALATMTWSAAPDAFVHEYLPEYRPTGGTWAVLPAVTTLTAGIPDIAPGYYDFRVRARNTIGALSSYSPTTTKEIAGLTAPPADLTNLTVIKSAGFALASWDLSPDLDVRIGGRIVVRHSSISSGATWSDGVILQEFNGDAVHGLVALMTGTYMVKAIDSTGNYSTNAAKFVATKGTVNGWTLIGTTTQEPAFTGTKTNIVLDAGTIKLDSSTYIDSVATLSDTWTTIDSLGGTIKTSGSYAFDTYLDLTTSATRRFETTLKAYSFDALSTIDDKTGLFDDLDPIDGNEVNDCDATLYIATTPDDPAGSPTWGSWTPFFVGDFTCRAAKFRLDLSTTNSAHNIQVNTLEVAASIPS